MLFTAHKVDDRVELFQQGDAFAGQLSNGVMGESLKMRQAVWVVVNG